MFTKDWNIDIFAQMDEKTKHDFIEIFNQGFEEIVLPQLEEIREDVSGIKQDVKEIKQDVKRFGISRDRVENYFDKTSDKIHDLDNRVTKLEPAS